MKKEVTGHSMLQVEHLSYDVIEGGKAVGDPYMMSASL